MIALSQVFASSLSALSKTSLFLDFDQSTQRVRSSCAKHGAVGTMSDRLKQCQHNMDRSKERNAKEGNS